MTVILRIANLLLCIVAVTLCLGRAYADGKPVRKTVLGKGRLVATDVGRGGPIYPPRWCGNAGLIFFGEKMGVEFIEFATGKRVRVNDNIKDARALNCTPDGKWLLYIDETIYRTPDGDKSWGPPFVQYIRRFETITGRTEKVGSMFSESGGAYDAMSPDGKKILLGPRHENAMDSAVPEWKGVWFRKDWDSAESKWFNDSSGIIFREHNPNALCAEVFGKGGWARCFKLGPEFKDNISDIVMDKDNRVYFKVNKYYVPVNGKDFLYRCAIGKKGVSCKKMFEREKGIIQFAPLPDGDLLLNEDGDHCIRRVKPGQERGECVAEMKHGDMKYHYIVMRGVSIDGKWLAITRSKIAGADEDNLFRQTDLFVIELSTE